MIEIKCQDCQNLIAEIEKGKWKTHAIAICKHCQARRAAKRFADAGRAPQKHDIKDFMRGFPWEKN